MTRDRSPSGRMLTRHRRLSVGLSLLLLVLLALSFTDGLTVVLRTVGLGG